MFGRAGCGLGAGIVGVFDADWTAAFYADEEVDDEVDWCADLALGDGDVRATAGYGEDREESAEGKLALPLHDGFGQKREIVAKLGVLLELAGECEEVIRLAEGNSIGLEKNLQLVNVATKARDCFLRV